jgi:hypothetical protein
LYKFIVQVYHFVEVLLIKWSIYRNNLPLLAGDRNVEYNIPVNAFKWKHFAGEIILLNIRWYLKYALSYKNLEEIMAER